MTIIFNIFAFVSFCNVPYELPIVQFMQEVIMCVLLNNAGCFSILIFNEVKPRAF